MAKEKAGFKTSEFWLLAVAEIAGLVMASGAFEAGGTVARIVGGAIAVLAGLGYVGSRTKVKSK